MSRILAATKPSRLLRCCYNITDKNRGYFTTGHMPVNASADLACT
jgi:hypothetical protein